MAAVPHGTSIGFTDHIQEAGSNIIMISNGSKGGREGGIDMVGREGSKLA